VQGKATMGRDDIIDLKEAGRIAGKAPRTIRRWVQREILKDLRAMGDTSSPMVVSEIALRAYLSTLSTPGRPSPKSSISGRGGSQGRAPADGWPPHGQPGGSHRGLSTATHGQGEGATHGQPAQPPQRGEEGSLVDMPWIPMDTQGGPATGRRMDRGEDPVASLIPGPINEEDLPLVRELRERLSIMERLISTVEKERDRLLREVEVLRQEIQESRQAREAVEREMAGTRGVRGLLKAFWPGG